MPDEQPAPSTPDDLVVAWRAEADKVHAAFERQRRHSYEAGLRASAAVYRMCADELEAALAATDGGRR